MALGFTSRDYWGAIFKQNSLTYIECQDTVDPEDLNSSHHSLSLGKKKKQTNKPPRYFSFKQCGRKYSIFQLEKSSKDVQRLVFLFLIPFLLGHHKTYQGFVGFLNYKNRHWKHFILVQRSSYTCGRQPCLLSISSVGPI